LASKEQEPILDVCSLSATLLAEQEVAPRARIFARFVAELLTEPAVNVYVLGSSGKGACWIPKASVGEAEVRRRPSPQILASSAPWPRLTLPFFAPPHN
jgi:hypothetical protein